MRRLALLIALLLAGSLSAQNTSVFRSKPYEHASVSVCVLDATTAKPIAQWNASQSVTPASVLKLLTTGAALQLLGPDFRFETTLSFSGTVEGEVLSGDLLLHGSGDPSLGSRQISASPEAFLTDWVKAVKEAGIRRIHGRILADARCFDDEGISPFWLWEDIGNYYATGIYGLNVFDNSFRLELQSGAPGTKPVVTGLWPSVPNLVVENHLKAADNDQDSAYLYGAPFQNEMRLFGTMPANRTAFVIRGQLPDPPSYLAYRLKEELRKAGIVVDGEALSSRLLAEWPSSKETKLFVTKSVPLTQLLRIIHEKSDNFYTECLLRRLACMGEHPVGSAREGIRVVKSVWQKKGLDLSALAQYDGCGLSPNNRISAELLAQVLCFLSKDSVFVQSLPLAGVEGTVSGFLKGTPLEGKLRLKSGSNQVVNSYAGFYRNRGKHYVVVLMVNHANASRSRIRKDMETFLLSL